MKGFAERLRSWREKRQLSQQDLASITGIHIGQISRYERGIILPSAETAVLLCRALKISADVLLFGDTQRDEPKEIGNLRLLERFRRLEKMSRDEQETAIKLIDALIAQDEIQQIVGRRPSR
jgi:transcriptional regulator with XRE-family HTH domain